MLAYLWVTRESEPLATPAASPFVCPGPGENTYLAATTQAWWFSLSWLCMAYIDESYSCRRHLCLAFVLCHPQLWSVRAH